MKAIIRLTLATILLVGNGICQAADLSLTAKSSESSAASPSAWASNIMRTLAHQSQASVARPSAVQRAATSGTYTTRSVDGLNQLVGSQSWAAENYKRAQGLKLTVGSNRQSVTLSLPNTWYGTVSGTLKPYPGYSNYDYFSGTRTLNTGVGLNAVYVEAIVLKNSSGRPIRMWYLVRSGNSLSAVVNGTGYGSSVSSAYEALVTFR